MVHPALQTKPAFIFIVGRQLIILLALEINHRGARLVFVSAEVSADGFQTKGAKWAVQSSAPAIGRSAGRRENGNFN